MRIPNHIVQNILEKARIEDIVSDYVTLTAKGDRLWGLSPFKSEKTPSFTVTPEKNVYYCFSTQKGGGVVQFVMEMEGLNYPEALEFLAQKLGIEIRHDDLGESEDFKMRKALEELNKRVMGSFHHLLLNSEEGHFALDYLLNRGISLSTITKFQIGYAPQDPFWLFTFLQSKGYSEKFLNSSGLFTKKNNKRSLFSHRLIFPIVDHSNRTLAFGGRILEGNGPKYLNSPETVVYHKSSLVYGLYQAKEFIRKEKRSIICEGYMDVLSLHEAGIFNVVAPLGTAFTKEQADIIKRYSDNTILFFDSDQAGVNATIKAINLLEQKSFSVQVANLSDDKDPGDILQKSGSQVLKNVVYSTSNALDFLLKQAVSRFPVSKPEGKEQAVEQLFDYIESVQSEVKRDGVFTVIAEYLDLSVESLRRDYRQQLKGLQGRENKFSKGGEAVVRFSKTNMNKQVPKDLVGQQKPAPMTNDLFLMLIVVVNFQYFGRVRSQVSAEDLRNPWACELYIVLEECFRNGEVSSESILSKIENQDLIKLVLEKQALNEFSVNPEQLIADSIKQVKIDKLLQRRREVEYQLKQILVANNNQQMLRELLADKMYIDQALNKLKVTIHDRTAE